MTNGVLAVLALLKEVTPDIIAAAKDAVETGELLDSRIRLSGNSIVIDTRVTRTGKNADGGDYDYWTVIIPEEDGFIVRRDWSCQLQDYGEDEVRIKAKEE